MKKRLAEIASNRQRLLEEIESQREEMAAIAQLWEKPLALADAAVGVLRFLRKHPVWVSAGVAMLLAGRGQGVFDLARKGWRLLGPHSSPFAVALELVFPALRGRRRLHETARPDKG
jgi:hypothetical protein